MRRIKREVIILHVKSNCHLTYVEALVEMVVVPCPVSGCSFQTSDRDPLIVAALLQLHAADHAAAASSSGRAGPKLDRPRIDAGVDEEVWNSFVRRWEAFRTGSQISNDVAPVQQLQCASEELAHLVLRSSPDVVSIPFQVLNENFKLHFEITKVQTGSVNFNVEHVKFKTD